MFAFFLFACYFVVLLLVLYRLVKKNQPSLSFGQTSAAFSFKVLLGCLYGYIFLHYYNGDDTWNFFQDSLVEYQKLFHQPGEFFKDFLPDAAFKEAHNFWEGMAFYIRNLEYWLMVKLLAIFNIFSRGNYYIDVLFFDFLVFWGSFLLFKLLLPVCPGKKNILLIVIFFVPTITFWLSGIRAEGLILLFMAMILYYTGKWFTQKKIAHFIWVIAGFGGFVIFRLQFLLVFLPAFISWTLSRKMQYKALNYFAAIYLGCVCIFFGSMLVSPKKNLSTPVVYRQQAFFALHGNTRFKLDSLQPSVPGFIKILPQAFANTFARPFIWEAKGPLQWMAGAEVMACWVLLGLLFIYPEKKWKTILSHPFLLFFIFYSISQMILIGYIVPFPGAIVRYKTIPELFFVIAIAITLDWSKLNYNNK